MLIVLAAPNALQLFAHHEPTLTYRLGDDFGSAVAARVPWQCSLPWLAAMSVLIAIVVFRLDGPSEFLYWQF